MSVVCLGLQSATELINVPSEPEHLQMCSNGGHLHAAFDTPFPLCHVSSRALPASGVRLPRAQAELFKNTTVLTVGSPAKAKE